MSRVRLTVTGLTVLVAIAFGGSPNACHGKPIDDVDAVAGPVRLVLPPVIYAIPELECNVYFDNVILTLNSKNYAFDVTSPVGLQFQERWAFTPSAEDIGEYPITIDVRDEFNTLVAHGHSTIRVADTQLPAADPATLLMVGASFTQYSIYPRHVLNLSRNGLKPGLVLVGSRGVGNMPPTDDLRHEGYSGWTAEAFAVLAGPLARSGYQQRGATGSPFVYESEDGSRVLDFGRYSTELNGGKGPDLVTIQVGTNDVFGANDDTIDQTIDEMFVHYNAVIESIHKFRRDTRVGVQMVTPPSISQDGFRNYTGAGKQTRWQFRRNQHRLMERMVRDFSNRVDEHIYLVPTYLNLDTAHHFPTWSPQINARFEQTMSRVNNGTHPSEPGYQQIGDTIYCWIVNMLASANK